MRSSLFSEPGATSDLRAHVALGKSLPLWASFLFKCVLEEMELQAEPLGMVSQADFDPATPPARPQPASTPYL